jgi:hypothetical protein
MTTSSTSDLTVFIARRDVTCGECGEALGRHAWITLDRERGALCLACADLDHLVFLPAGDAALTRRAKKHSTLSAVVLEWSRARDLRGIRGRIRVRLHLQRWTRRSSSKTMP